MEAQGCSLNSTRLSMDIANLPLTPFGMNHRGSKKKRHPAGVGSPCGNKLSLKSLKTPPKGDRETNALSSGIRGTQRPASPLTVHSAIPEVGQLHPDTHSNLATVYESEDVGEEDSYDASASFGRSEEVIVNNLRPNSVNTISGQRPNPRNLYDNSNRKRDSTFTDIDEGSFIEFYHGKENNPPFRVVREQGRGIPQLYYTCESHNDTVFSTSTKTKAAVVGFRKYVEKIRTEKSLQHITEEGDLDNDVPELQVDRNFPFDETIITCSLDVRKQRKNGTTPKAINSTMISRRPSGMQNCHPVCLPDISTLTIQTNTESRKCTPNTSPNHSKSDRMIHTTVIIESSDSENSVGALNIVSRKGTVIPYSAQMDNVSQNRSCMDPPPPSWKSANVDHNAVVFPGDRPVETRLQEEEVFCTPDEHNSLISEDVSVIDSVAGNRAYYQIQSNIETQTQGPTHWNVESASRKSKENIPTKGQGDQDYDADSEGKALREPPRRQTPVNSNEVESPDVANWVLTSPFKEGSYGSSFLHRHDTLDISETPSQPKLRTSAGNAVKALSQRSPSSNKVPRFYCVRENVLAPDFKAVLYKNDQVLNVMTPDKPVVINPDNLEGPTVSKWVMTSPFEDGSYDSSFLQRPDTSDISQSPSQPKSKENLDSSGSCERSLNIRLAERIKTSCNKSLLQSIQNEGNEERKESYSSDCEDSDEVARIQNVRKAGVQRNPITRIVSESDDSSDSEANLKKSPYRNVNDRKRKDYKNKSHVSETTEMFSEASQSLHLRLSEGLTKSLKTSEKSLYTIGGDAASPNSLDRNTKSESLASESEDSFLRKRVGTDNRLRISDSEDEEQSDASLPDLTEPIGNTNTKKSKVTTVSPIRRGKKYLDSKQSSENSDQIYGMATGQKKTDRRKEVCNKRVNRRPKRTTRKSVDYVASDEDSSVENSISSSDKKEPKSRVTEREESSPVSLGNGRKKTGDDAYFSSSASEDECESSFENYLKSVKKQILKENDKKARLSQSDDKDQDDIGDFIDDDDESDDESFYLPPLRKRLSNDLDWRSLGSVSDDLRTRIMIKQNQQNLPTKKKKEPKFVTTSPITNIRKPLIKKAVTNTKSWRNCIVVDCSSDSDIFPEKEISKKPDSSLPFITPINKVPPKVKPKTEAQPRQRPVSRKLECNTANGATPTLTFLASLSSTIHTVRCHPDAVLYVKSFKKKKEDLCEKLYSYYNKHIFSEKLPATMNMKWNPRLTKTAGFCYYQIDRSKLEGRGARIELSSKVIDVPERLRDTLIHEMCHAAAWIISGYKDGHGPLWKSWASRARSIFPELPSITTCHSYKINCKYTYRCTVCSYSIGRHSKSLDTERKVCGYCYGKFELVVNSRGKGTNFSNSSTPGSQANPKTPRTPNAFALFVKDNYNTIKKSKQNLKHAEVMKMLSVEFGKMKTSNN